MSRNAGWLEKMESKSRSHSSRVKTSENKVSSSGHTYSCNRYRDANPLKEDGDVSRHCETEGWRSGTERLTLLQLWTTACSCCYLRGDAAVHQVLQQFLVVMSQNVFHHA